VQSCAGAAPCNPLLTAVISAWIVTLAQQRVPEQLDLADVDRAGALAPHFLDPLDHTADRVNGLTNLINRASVGAEDFVLRRNQLSFHSLYDPSYVGPLAMRDVCGMPKDAQGALVRHPEQLSFIETPDFVQGM